MIDPLGLALENFDVTGVWRIKDNGAVVDPVGDLYDGTKLDGPIALRNALLKHQDVFMLSFTESLMTYALGRRVESLRHAGDPPDRARREGEELPVLSVHLRRRQQRRLPHGARRSSGNDDANTVRQRQ